MKTENTAKYVLGSLILIVLLGAGLLWRSYSRQVVVTTSEVPSEEVFEPVPTGVETETINQSYSRPEGGNWGVADGQSINSMNLTFESVDALEEEVDSNTLPDKQKKPNNASAATEAAKQKFIEGLDAFNQGNYTQARAAWVVAKQLDPSNSDADLGLQKVEELMGIR